jgi:hypothetical protein
MTFLFILLDQKEFRLKHVFLSFTCFEELLIAGVILNAESSSRGADIVFASVVEREVAFRSKTFFIEHEI